MNINYIDKAAKDGKDYLIASKKFFQRHSSKMVEANHYQHNLEPNYWNIMLRDLKENDQFIGKSCLEYGCGAGRNLVNMSILGGFSRADGIDISKTNAKNAQKFAEEKLKSYSTKIACLEGDGYTCLPFKNESYDFIISHQVFIHIPNYSVGCSIISEVKRILKNGGIFITHFKTIGDNVGYFENYSKFPKNVEPSSSKEIEDDFSQFGFSDLKVIEAENFVDNKPEWFVRCIK